MPRSTSEIPLAGNHGLEAVLQPAVVGVAEMNFAKGTERQRGMASSAVVFRDQPFKVYRENPANCKAIFHKNSGLFFK